MSWGLQNRIASIIKPHNNRALMLAVDHGYFLGPTERLEDARKTIRPLLKYCDSLMLTRGVQRNCVDSRTPTPMVLRVSGGSSIIGEDLSQEDITVSIEDAIRLNASALAMSMFVGSKYEYQTVVNLGKLVGEAERYGLPVLAVTAVGKDLGKDARYLSLACRMAAEQGAHIVKTYYCDDFKKVVDSCPVPIIVAGGKKIPERDAMQLTYNAIRGGAVGVDMGRNIWQSDHPVAMIRAIRSIVHSDATVSEAYSMYQDLSAQEKPSTGKRGGRPGKNSRPKSGGPNKNKGPQVQPNKNKESQGGPQKPSEPQADKDPHRKNTGNVITADAVWIALATLHREHGRDSTFRHRDIFDRVKKQNLCNVSDVTIRTHISSHCVANIPSQGNPLRMIYVESRGEYRLCRKDDDYHPSRHGPMQPPIAKIPEQYRELLTWYNDEFCSKK